MYAVETHIAIDKNFLFIDFLIAFFALGVENNNE